jgi:hypothetical protein
MTEARAATRALPPAGGGAAGEGITETLRGWHETVAGIGAGADVLTADGAIAIEHLEPGDRIVTRSGLRPLRALRSRVWSGAAVEIAGGALGHDRPDAALRLAPGQAVRISPRVAARRAASGQPSVPGYATAAALADTPGIARAAPRPTRFYSLHFDAPEVIYADGVELLCLPEESGR